MRARQLFFWLIFPAPTTTPQMRHQINAWICSRIARPQRAGVRGQSVAETLHYCYLPGWQRTQCLSVQSSAPRPQLTAAEPSGRRGLPRPSQHLAANDLRLGRRHGPLVRRHGEVPSATTRRTAHQCGWIQHAAERPALEPSQERQPRRRRLGTGKIMIPWSRTRRSLCSY
jgi:hypothetical protein